MAGFCASRVVPAPPWLCAMMTMTPGCRSRMRNGRRSPVKLPTASGIDSGRALWGSYAGISFAGGS
jgi:hypothetical protein